MEQIVKFDEHGNGVITGELVRCGECKYHMAETERINPYCAKYHCMRTDDWFCADGEKEVQE